MLFSILTELFSISVSVHLKCLIEKLTVTQIDAGIWDKALLVVSVSISHSVSSWYSEY